MSRNSPCRNQERLKLGAARARHRIRGAGCRHPQPQRFSELAKICEFSPPAAVPVLVDGDTVNFDSPAIMEYASDIGERPLLPADARQRARARSLSAWMHGGYPPATRDDGNENAGTDRILEVWNDELAASGGPYLAGDLSLADLAFVPVVRRLQAHHADASSWPLPAARMRRLMGTSHGDRMDGRSRAFVVSPVGRLNPAAFVAVAPGGAIPGKARRRAFRVAYGFTRVRSVHVEFLSRRRP